VVGWHIGSLVSCASFALQRTTAASHAIEYLALLRSCAILAKYEVQALPHWTRPEVVSKQVLSLPRVLGRLS
jgi:hypothetical protein